MSFSLRSNIRSACLIIALLGYSSSVHPGVSSWACRIWNALTRDRGAEQAAAARLAAWNPPASSIVYLKGAEPPISGAIFITELLDGPPRQVSGYRLDSKSLPTGEKVTVSYEELNIGVGFSIPPKPKLQEIMCTLRDNPRQVFEYAVLPDGSLTKGLRYPALYHGTDYYDSVEDIFSEMNTYGGLVRGQNGKPKLGADIRLLDHMLAQSQAELGGSSFRGTTIVAGSPGHHGTSAMDFAGDDGFIFEIADTRGWNISEVNALSEGGIPITTPRANEIAIPRFVPKERIKRIGQVLRNSVGRLTIEWIDNPYYIPIP